MSRSLLLFLGISIFFTLTACERSNSFEADNMFQGKLAAELAEATRKGDIDRVKELIVAGADVKATDQESRTLLWWAMINNQPQTFKLLLESGADPTTHSSSGETIVHASAMLNTPEFLKILLKHGVPVDIESAGGRTPLFDAFGGGQAKILLDHGADINHRNRMNDTPLYEAAALDDYDNVLKLLKSGADPTVVTKRGSTFQNPLASGPEEHAYTEEARQKREQIRQWLRAHDIPVEF